MCTILFLNILYLFLAGKGGAVLSGINELYVLVIFVSCWFLVYKCTPNTNNYAKERFKTFETEILEKKKKIRPQPTN